MEAASPPFSAIAEAIVAAVNPRRVILFGSHATGRAGPHSDVDLLVVEDGATLDGQARWDETVRVQQALAPFRLPKDILVYAEGEVEWWGATTNHVVARALREGRVLYERPA